MMPRYFLFLLFISSLYSCTSAKLLLPDQDRFSRNANHHDHSHDHSDDPSHDHNHNHDHNHDPEAIFDRAARFGLRVVDGKDREGADDLGNDLDFLAQHDHQVEHLRKLLKNGLTLGELFATSTELRTTTPKSMITLSTVRLPIKDHNHWQDSPSELVVHDNVAELVYPKQEHTTVKTEYLTDTPYYTQDDIGLTTPESTRTHEPILINDRVEDYYYYDDDYYYYDEEEYNTLFLDEGNETRTPRTPRSFDTPRIGRKILSAEPSHLRMSEREMEHMMMMMLHNAVTQVEMEDLETPGSSRSRRPKSRPKSRLKSRPKSRTTSRPRQRRPNDAFGGSLLPPVQNEANNEVNSRSRGRPQRLRDEARLKEAQRQKEEEERQSQQRREEAARKRDEQRRKQQQEEQRQQEELRRQQQIEQQQIEQQRRQERRKQKQLEQQEQKERRRQKQLEQQQQKERRQQKQLEQQQQRREQQQQRRKQQQEEERRNLEILRQQQLEEQHLLQQQQLRQELEQQRRLQQQLQQQQQQTTPRTTSTPPPRLEPARPLRPPLVTEAPRRRPRPPPRKPIAVAQVRPSVQKSSKLQSLNQIPRNQGTKSSSARRGKAFRTNNSRNRIFPPPPNIPETNFDCANYEFPGLYADTEANCEVFHMCQSTGHVNSFKCPAGTRFDQRHMVCNWSKKVKCEQAPEFFINNRDLYLK